MSDHYDVIVIGSGPGGASVAHRLAPTGKRILLLERGDYLPRSPANWDSQTVFVDGAYQAPETWYGADGRTFHPGLHYYVGGNSKVYGAALFRMRERDFEEIVHKDGLSPAWPLKYGAFERYYAEAEQLFHVHGQRGEDPNEPPSNRRFPYPPVSHEPHIQALSENLAKDGLHPFHLPLGILLDEKDGRATPTSICIRCDAFDGFPCLLNGKADAQVICVDPALKSHPNLTLLTGTYVSKLETSESGRSVTNVRVTRSGQEERYSADVVVVACGALSSALLLLRSSNEMHPEGNMEAHHRLKKKLEQMLGHAGAHPVLLERSLYLGKNIPIGGTAHQAGTARFGTDPATSVLDMDCKAHELDNLYVADASFFPSIGAVNPTLTIIANALRVADKIKQRLGAKDQPS